MLRLGHSCETDTVPKPGLVCLMAACRTSSQRSTKRWFEPSVLWYLSRVSPSQHAGLHFPFLLFVHVRVHVRTHTYVSVGTHGDQKSVSDPRSGVTGGCKLLAMDAGN